MFVVRYFCVAHVGHGLSKYVNTVFTLRLLTDTGSLGDSGNFVDGQGKVACIIRLCKCFCDTVSGRKCDGLFWII